MVSLGTGVLLRPHVLGDQRTAASAVVYDCYLQNDQYMVRGTEPELDELATAGQVATMRLVSGQWIVDVIYEESQACF